MRAGGLQQRITFQEQASTQDAYGETTGTWTDVEDWWAKITPVSGREGVLSEQTTDAITHTILIRWRNGTTARNRITYNDRVFNIHAVRNIDEQQKEMILECIEIVGQSA